MSSSELNRPVDKGKGRARSQDSSERTPLLASQSHTSNDRDAEADTRARSRRRLWSKLIIVFCITLSICIISFIVLAVLAYSYAERAAHLSPEDILDHAVTAKGPDRIDVLNITSDGGIWLNVEGRVGVDAGAVIGVNSNEDDGLLTDLWKAFGRWGIRTIDRVNVQLDTIRISPGDDPLTVLASLHMPPMDVRLIAQPPSNFSWLTKVSIPIFIAPTQNASVLMKFVRDSWRDGAVTIQAHVDQVAVKGGSLSDHSWRRKIDQTLDNVNTILHMKIPALPGLPSPGRNSPFPSVSDLLTLETFGVMSSPEAMSLYARATIIDPAPLSFNFTSPSLPFIVSLPTTGNDTDIHVPVALVRTEPFTLTHPNITLHIAGTVLPISPDSTPTLSSFITNYLSGESSPIIITSPYFPAHVIDTVFPGPNPKPRILRNVTIYNMKLVPKGTSFVASGTVYAKVVLPQGMKVGLEINRVLPDVLVFDGEVPLLSVDPTFSEAGGEKDGDSVPPLPDPLPERAFARIRPEEWLDADSEADETIGDEGSVYTVTADIIEVPLQVLPGRQKDFSNFVSKVVFGTHGAVAGILGTAAVAIDVQGLPTDHGATGEMELSGLPFQGSVVIGKKGL